VLGTGRRRRPCNRGYKPRDGVAATPLPRPADG
jgi:hypothetical protein